MVNRDPRATVEAQSAVRCLQRADSIGATAPARVPGTDESYAKIYGDAGVGIFQAPGVAWEAVRPA